MPDPGTRTYSDEVPPEMRDVLRGMAGEERLGILIALIRNGEMTFKEMKEVMGLQSSSLSHHLGVLQEGGLVRNFYKKRDERGFSYYRVTDVPRAVLDALFDILYEPKSGPAAASEVPEPAGVPPPRPGGARTASMPAGPRG